LITKYHQHRNAYQKKPQKYTERLLKRHLYFMAFKFADRGHQMWTVKTIPYTMKT